RLAERAQDPHQRKHGRCLAGAAEMIVADAKHGNAGIDALLAQTPRRDRAIERAERPEQMRLEGRRPVPEARLTHWRLPFRAEAGGYTAPARPAGGSARPPGRRPRPARGAPPPR